MKDNVSKYYVASFFWHFSLILPVSLLYYRELGLTFAEIGALWVGMGVASMVVEIPAGVFCDQYGRRPTVLVGSLLTAVALVSVFLSDEFNQVLMACAAWGAAGAFMSGAVDALLYDSLDGDDRDSVYIGIRSRLLVVQAVSMVSASIIGGLLYTVGPGLPFLGFGVAWAVATMIVLTMKEPAPRSVGVRRGHIEVLHDALSFSWRSVQVRWLIAFAAIVSLPTFAFLNLLRQPYLVGIGFEPTELGAIFAVIAGLGAILGSLSQRVEMRLQESGSRVLIVGGPAVLFALASRSESWTGLIAVVLLYACFHFQDAVLSAYLNREVDASIRATVLSAQSFITRIVQIALIGVAGSIADSYGIQTLLVSMSTFLLVAGSACLLIRPRGHDRISSPNR